MRSVLTQEGIVARLAIQDRLAACTQAGDVRDADAYAASFTTDGLLALADGVIEGREEIRAWMRKPSVIPALRKPTGPVYINHHLTTCHIRLTAPDRAEAKTYWLVTGPGGLDHNGYYKDMLRRLDAEWLIERRPPCTLWIAETSLLR